MSYALNKILKKTFFGINSHIQSLLFILWALQCRIDLNTAR